MAFSAQTTREINALIKKQMDAHLLTHHTVVLPPAPTGPTTPTGPTGPVATGPVATGPSGPVPTPPSGNPPANSITAISLGLKGDGSDESDAFQAALDRLGDRVLLLDPTKTYAHSKVLYMRSGSIYGGGVRQGDAIVGAATIASTAQWTSAFRMYTGTRMSGVRLTSNATTRGVANEQHKLNLSGARIIVDQVMVEGSCGAGIYAEGCSDYTISNVVVKDTLADSIHNTGGSYNGVITNPIIINSGDDGVAVVSYGGQYPCHHITATNVVVRGGKARGVSVVGGEDVTYRNLVISDTAAAGIYISREPSYNTLNTRRVLVEDFLITGANYNTATHHGSVLLYGEGGTVENCTVRNGSIFKQAGAAPWHLAAFHGGAVKNCQLESILVKDAARANLVWNAAGITVTGVTRQSV